MDKILKDKNRMISTEYEVREINADGDAIDVNHYDTLEEAKIYANSLMQTHGAIAVVIEKHISKRPAHMFADPDVYESVLTLGDKGALNEGGWNTHQKIIEQIHNR